METSFTRMAFSCKICIIFLLEKLKKLIYKESTIWLGLHKIIVLIWGLYSAISKPGNNWISDAHWGWYLWHHCEEMCENVWQMIGQTVMLVSLKPALFPLHAFVCTTWASVLKCHPDHTHVWGEAAPLLRSHKHRTFISSNCLSVNY